LQIIGTLANVTPFKDFNLWKDGRIVSSKRRTIILGCVFIFFLASAYFENMYFLEYVKDVFTNPPLAVAMVFLHNVIAVSLIIIGMKFYVEFVLNFLPKKDFEYAVLRHSRFFAIIFTAIILIVSILRVATLLHGQIMIDLIAIIMLLSLPHGVVEACGIYKSIHKTLANNLTNKALVTIYIIFLFAAILEVGFVQALLWSTA